MLQAVDLGTADVVVIGGGLAAMHAALEAGKAKATVVLVSKKPVGRSGASVISKSVHRFAPAHITEKSAHKKRIMEGGRLINNEALVDVLVEQGSRRVSALGGLNVGLNFKTAEIDGKRYENFAACRPKLGKYMTVPLADIVKSQNNIKILEGYMAIQLILDGDAICGILMEKQNKLYFLGAKAVVLATGGGGYVYSKTSNTNDLTGDGYAMALQANIPLVDMEFVQFYPYRIVYPFLHDIFPDTFKYGAKFLNEKGQRFMDKYPNKELENRDVLAREMFYQKEIYLELEDCDKQFLKEECDDLYDNYQKHADTKIKVQPTAHFMMGGIKIGADTFTAVKGLFCCGEAAGGLHGANRLAGHALTETAVFGPIAGEQAARFAKGRVKVCMSIDDIVTQWLPPPGQNVVSDIKNTLRALMWESAGILKEGHLLRRAKESLEALDLRINELKPVCLRDWLECHNMIKTSMAIVNSALLREESRGAHYRADFPEEQPDWQGNIIIKDGNAVYMPLSNK